MADWATQAARVAASTTKEAKEAKVQVKAPLKPQSLTVIVGDVGSMATVSPSVGVRPPKTARSFPKEVASQTKPSKAAKVARVAKVVKAKAKAHDDRERLRMRSRRPVSSIVNPRPIHHQT